MTGSHRTGHQGPKPAGESPHVRCLVHRPLASKHSSMTAGEHASTKMQPHARVIARFVGSVFPPDASRGGVIVPQPDHPERTARTDAIPHMAPCEEGRKISVHAVACAKVSLCAYAALWIRPISLPP